MDSKVPQYQRAVTPTIIDSNASPNLVRGKLLSYNSNVIRTGRAGPVSDKLFGSMNSIPSPSLSVGASLSPRGSVGGTETSVQGRSSSGKSTGASSGKYTSEGIASGAGIDSLATAFSVLPRYDLVPISSELPSDGIIFARTKTLPEMLVVFRTTEERLRNPERLNLDRRQLEICPLLEQEQRLRLLNFQNNNIHAIQNLENLPNLIFLDLYNNKISSLDGPLSTVKGLRVLMAGKNKISAISNLRPLRKLDVLDLHSNEIRLIEGLDGLSDLRVLNLAGAYSPMFLMCV
jgi:Leucine-rich repeat (LRR) protein